MSDSLCNKHSTNNRSRSKYFYGIFFLLLINVNLCLTFIDDNNMVPNDLNIPSLHDICSQNDLSTQPMDYDTNLIGHLESMLEDPIDANISDGFWASNLNQTLDKILLLCIDHLSGSNQNESSTKRNNIEKRRQNNLRPNTKEIMSILPSEVETNDAYFDPTEEIISDPEWLTMLKEFDILAEVVRNKSSLLEDELNINYTETSSLGNNTFLKSAITLYDTFINHYNMTGIPVQHASNGTFHPFDDIDENDNGILFHHTSILSSSNRYAILLI